MVRRGKVGPSRCTTFTPPATSNEKQRKKITSDMAEAMHNWSSFSGTFINSIHE